MNINKQNQKILLLGARGFIGSNLLKNLNKRYLINISGIDSSYDELNKLVCESDIIIHTIGVTRSDHENDFFRININFSFNLYTILNRYKNKKIIYLSSIHYSREDLYGFSKRYNEYLFSMIEFLNKHQSFIIRTPGIYGPGAKPNNVSVVSTFCYDAVHNIQSTINEPDKILEILFIDDLILLIESLFEINKRHEIIHPKTDKISVLCLYNLIHDISKNSVSDSTFRTNFLENISTTYNSFKNASE